MSKSPSYTFTEAAGWGLLAALYGWLHVSSFGAELSGRALVSGSLFTLNVGMAIGLAALGVQRMRKQGTTSSA